MAWGAGTRGHLPWPFSSCPPPISPHHIPPDALGPALLTLLPEPPQPLLCRSADAGALSPQSSLITTEQPH